MKMSAIEKFCDIYSVIPCIVDEGFFTGNGFYSTMNNIKCRCKTRSEHYDNCLMNTFVLLR